MTGKLIFKMELFKFLRDKSFLITAGVIGGLNIVITLLALSVSNGLSDNYYQSETTASLLGTIAIVGVIIFLGNIAFAYIYPFHMIAMDYKNNVMAMLVASGVNRRKLFFAKIGAIFVCTIALMLIMTLIPFLLCIVKLFQVGGWDTFIASFSAIFYYTDLSFGKVLFSGLLGYLNMLTLVATACIMMKGKNLSFLLFIGFNVISSIVSGILSTTSYAFNFSSTGVYVFQLFLSLLSTGVFGYIALRTLEKQNL